MRLLLDSHTLLWAVDDPSKLSPAATTAVQDPANNLLVSAATIWEVAIKVGLGKPSISQPYKSWMTKALSDLGALVLPITVDYADAQMRMPMHYRDPFDRLLIAQALVESIQIVSADVRFDLYGIARLW